MDTRMDGGKGSRLQRELATVYEISKILASSLDCARTFREALNVLSTHMDFRRGMIVLLDDDKNLTLEASCGLSPQEREVASYRAGEGVIGRVASTGIPAVIPDISREPAFLNRTGALDSAGGRRIALVCVPIRASQEVLGVLSVDQVNEDQARRYDEDVRLLSMLATLFAQSVLLQRAVRDERERLVSEARRLKLELKGRYKISNVVGVSKIMQEVFAEAHQAAPSKSTVLLRGESGTGKEVIARAIHELSPRKDGPFIKLNCAALTESLLESELFGHEKGAFTGAAGERKGRFELAHGGTLFLDEIGDISAAFQAKLLRVLQEREFERVGGSKPIKVDVRLVFATNRNLEKMVSEGKFRADLYYRINVVSLFLPPLRERREDIPALVAYFVDRYNKENQRDMRVSADAMRVLSGCYWPGNVRELENCIERTATMTQGDTITELNFPCYKNRCLTQTLHHMDKTDAVEPAHVPVESIGHATPRPPVPPPLFSDEKPEGERERLIWAMERSGWVQAKAARLLNITPRQMGYALQKHGIEVRRF